MDECPICLDDLDESSPTLACGHSCHAHCLGQLAHALGSTPTRRGTKLTCPTCRRESRVAICAPPTAEFSVGDAVLGLWGHRWFPGVVDAVIDGGRAYEIAYDDGDLGQVTAKHCRRRRDPVTPAPDEDENSPESDGEETVVHVEWQAPRYHGIQWDSGQHKWMARYKNPNTGERVIVGYYSDDIEAARAHDAAVRAAGLGKSFSYTFNHRLRNLRRGGTNPYIGVVWDSDSKKYKAEYEDANGDSQHIGDFDDAVKAAEAYNATIRREGLSSTRELNPLYDGVPIPREEARRRGAARRCGGRKGIKLNRELNGVLIPLPPEEPNFDGSEVVPPIRSGLMPHTGLVTGGGYTGSQYLGVSWNAEPPRWTARFHLFKNIHNHPGQATVVIGYFRTEEEAALAYNAAIRRYGLESTHKTNPVVNGAPVLKPRAWISPYQPKGPQIRESLLRRKRAAPGRFKAPERPELSKRHRMRKAEREWRELARAAPAPAKKRRGALDGHNGAGLREAPLHPRRRSVPVRRFSAETPDEERGD